MEEIVLKIIIHAGNAKSMLYEALDYADELIENANEEILKAHKVQTELIQKEAGGDKSDISILLIHSQDHLMTCMSERNLIKEMIMLRKEIQKLK